MYEFLATDRQTNRWAASSHKAAVAIASGGFTKQPSFDSSNLITGSYRVRNG